RRRHPVPHHGPGRGRGRSGHRRTRPRRGRGALAAATARVPRLRPGRDRRAGVAVSPVQEAAEVFAAQRVGDYVVVTVVAPALAGQARPGQFLPVAVGGPSSAMPLRRAFAIYDVTPGSEFAGTVQFVVAPRGPGTRWLAAQPAGAVLDLVGP